MSRTQNTIEVYKKIGFQLWNRAARNLNVDRSKLCPMQYIEWLKKSLTTLKPSTKRQYIAASREYLNQKMMVDGSNPDLETAVVESMKLQAQDCIDPALPKIKVKRTSAQKSKIFDTKKFSEYFSKEIVSKPKWGGSTITWVIAGIFTGLRPCEWRQAKLIEDGNKYTLKVRNAKATNGRSHGEFRHINISALRLNIIEMIKKHIKSVNQFNTSDKEWNRFYHGCRDFLYDLYKKYEPKSKLRPSLYTTRHQFASNAKSAELDLATIAALMGHAADSTVSRRYGKKKNGSGQFKITPEAGEVEKVRLTYVKRKRNMKPS